MNGSQKSRCRLPRLPEHHIGLGKPEHSIDKRTRNIVKILEPVVSDEVLEEECVMAVGLVDDSPSCRRRTAFESSLQLRLLPLVVRIEGDFEGYLPESFDSKGMSVCSVLLRAGSSALRHQCVVPPPLVAAASVASICPSYCHVFDEALSVDCKVAMIQMFMSDGGTLSKAETGSSDIRCDDDRGTGRLRSFGI
ncbi:unnamed protein product [Soboliphyme baturini]|uniref:Uncharacterized protein n=1 Tax=Soboliphyme baturini TaxID=241478 RepID=A0A183IQ44_9BILA|nr:unnamed protein product [Soboliphyme baturini]